LVKGHYATVVDTRLRKRTTPRAGQSRKNFYTVTRPLCLKMCSRQLKRIEPDRKDWKG
jgi:hypothetical protein